MKKNYGLILSFLFLFVSGIMNAQINANFTAGVIGRNSYFTNTTSSNPSTNTLAYTWDFGDGSGTYYTVFKNTFAHDYTQIGTFQVTLIAFDTTGSIASDTITKNIEILCIADFNYSMGFGNTVLFEQNNMFDSTKTTSSNFEYDWLYTDSNISGQGYKDTHTFPTYGTYTVKHVFYASNISGSVCIDTVIKTINISQNNCKAYFIDSFSTDTTHHFSANQYFSPTVKFTWDFGDGTSGTGVNTMHAFYPGTYNVCVTITDSTNSCFASYCDSIVVSKSNPCAGTAQFGYTINSGNNVDFMADSLIGNSANFYWNFGDGISSNQRNPNHTYSTSGSYNVLMFYYDASGCSDSISKTVNLTTNSCQANFNFSIYTNSVYFNDASTAANVSILKYFWNFGDGSTSTQKNPIHIYSSTNNYIVVLAINDSLQNCTSYYTDTVNITCVIDFTYTVSGDTLKITNTSTMPSGVSYNWNFGDGNTSNSVSPIHLYSVSDTVYSVMLSVNNSPGCNGTVYKQIVIGTPKQDIFVSYSKHPYDPAIYPTYAARLYLIEYDTTNQTLTAIDSADVFNDSFYTFANVNPGKYLVKAALLAADSDYYNYLPTYSDTSLLWSNAILTNHSILYNSHAIIHFIQGTNPGGSGFIAGYVYQGANKKEGPLENIDVYLISNDGTPVTFAKTDIEGKYEFKNLAFGEYRIRVEVLGKTSEEYNVFLDQNNPSVTENNFDVNKNEIVKRTPNASVKNIQNTNLKLYPNPVNDYLNIELENDAKNIEIEIYDISGSLILKNKMNSNEKIDVSNIKTGIYFIQIQTDNLTKYRQKFLKD